MAPENTSGRGQGSVWTKDATKNEKPQKAALKNAKLYLAGGGHPAYTIRSSSKACSTDNTDI